MEYFERSLIPEQSSTQADIAEPVFNQPKVPVRAQTAKAKRSSYNVSGLSASSVTQASTGYSKQEWMIHEFSK